MKSTPRLMIGIDAGATKTAAVSGAPDGRVLDRVRLGPSAIVGLPDTQALSVLKAVVDQLAPRRDSIDQIVIGLSGVDFAEEHLEQWRVIAAALNVPRDKLLLVNDSVVALAGAAEKDRATLVQHGTEVTMAWRMRAGNEVVFDSVGIADCFDLRLKVVAVVARMLDGRLPVTPLRDRVLAHCDVSAADFPRWMVREPRARETILRVAPVVFSAWQEGDPAAERLVEQAIDDYVGATVAMAARMGPGPFQACFGGGALAQGGPAFIAAISAGLLQKRPDAIVCAPAASPEEGALTLARQAARAAIASS